MHERALQEYGGLKNDFKSGLGFFVKNHSFSHEEREMDIKEKVIHIRTECSFRLAPHSRTLISNLLKMDS